MSEIVFGVIITLVLILLVILFVIILVKLYIQKIKSHKQELYQNQINQQKAITETIIETQENTLDLIANELHDDAGQQLTYINLQVEQLKLKHPNFNKELNALSASIVNLSNSVRALSHTISHQKIKQTNLIDSFKNEISRINKLNLIDCCIEISDNFKYEFSETERILLFRMFQEIINNVLKHSRASKFVVTIKQNPSINLIFIDDGKGFNLDQLKWSNTNGLLNLKHRAELIGFVFEIKSKIKLGTTIKLSKKTET